MATARIRYVNPHSSGGNGTTAALSGANAAYASLQAAISAEAGNLVSADVWLEIICATEGNADTSTSVYLQSSAWTVDATRNIRISVADGSRHAGVWGDTKYRITNSDYNAVGCEVPFTTIDGLQVHNGIDDNGIACFLVNTTACVVSRCIGKFNGNTYTYGTGVNHFIGPVDNTGTPNKVVNCLFYGAPTNRAFVGIRADNSYLEVYNCTIVGNDYAGSVGIRDSYGRVTAKNNLVTDCETPFYGGFASTDYNATDTTSSYAGTNGRTSQTFSFRNAAAKDYGLLASDTGAKGYGLTDPGSGLFDDDILGNTRSAPWDIGAFQYQPPSDAVIPARRYNHLLIR